MGVRGGQGFGSEKMKFLSEVGSGIRKRLACSWLRDEQCDGKCGFSLEASTGRPPTSVPPNGINDGRLKVGPTPPEVKTIPSLAFGATCLGPWLRRPGGRRG
jgi:hypothetical protein